MTIDLTRRPTHPVLILNPNSGGGKAAKFDLVQHCSGRGIEAVVFTPGDDLSALAVAALDAFFEADERRIDIARVNGRAFLNNVAMGSTGRSSNPRTTGTTRYGRRSRTLPVGYEPTPKRSTFASSKETVLTVTAPSWCWCRTTGTRPSRGHGEAPEGRSTREP
ncbi:MAG TPA: hypothetical protein VHT75_10075 [Acidimicrobiales bacterium]|jgi:hypothetical protein|nr:hypothetical protein [Acidimicrobiales bacterium]